MRTSTARGWNAVRRFTLGLAISGLVVTASITVDRAGAAALTSTPSDPAPTVSSIVMATDNTPITFDGATFAPALVRAEPGTPIELRNEGPDVLSIMIEPGGYDISPIAAGGAAVTILDEGSYEYTEYGSGASGRILIGTTSFGGAATDPVEDHIPDAWFPLEPDELRPPHPLSGIPTSLSRIMLTFVPGTTVADAEAALARSGAVIVGGLPSSGILLALVAGTPDHAALDASLEALRADPVVEAAADDQTGETNVLPAPPDIALTCPFLGCIGTGEWSQGTTDDGLPLGEDVITWMWEAPRFPQAWNLADNVAPTPLVTAILDHGFAADHQDLANFTLRELCVGDTCSGLDAPTKRSQSSRPVFDPATGQAAVWNGTLYVDATTGLPFLEDAHGTNVAGLAGAVHETPGFGTPGANPRATMIGVGLSNPSVNSISVVEEVLDRKAAGDPAYRDVRVINLSWGSNYGEAWAKSHRDLTCGPGDDDDDDPATIGPCLPWTDDVNIDTKLNGGIIAIRLAHRMVDLGVVLAQSAGNDGADFCVLGDELFARSELLEGVVCPPVAAPSSLTNSAFTVASSFLDAAGATNPIFIVEALGSVVNGNFVASLQRAPFSQMNGHLSAPGYVIGPSTTRYDGVSKHVFMNGTSQATPIVAGLLSYLIQLDPTVSVSELRNRIATFGDSFDPVLASSPAPRIDAFGSVMRVPGAIEALLDVDDGSLDGNRRVIYGPGGGIAGYDTDRRAGEPLTTAKTIDIRDFRAYRDAWLALCQSGSADGDCANAMVAGIFLDGTADHPKHDLNRDGCVGSSAASAATCPDERLYPRADFNGDGVVDSDAEYPFEIDAMSTSLTDLGVLAARFTPAPDGEGWYAEPEALEAKLRELLVSGDVEVNVAGLLAAGATDLEVELRDETGTRFVRPLSEGAEAMVVTAPAGGPIEIIVRADRGGTAVEYSDSWTLAAGQDVRYDPCNVIRVVPDDTGLAMGATMNVSAELVSCDTVDLSGVTVEFEITRNGDITDTVINPQQALTDADGNTASVLEAGTSPGTYVVSAMADLPVEGGTIEVVGTAQVEVETGYAIAVLDSAPVGRLGTNPSIAADGDVTYTARTSTPSGADPSPPFDQIWRSESSGLIEIAQRARDLVPDGSTFGTRVDARADDWAFAHAFHDNEAVSDADREFREYALRMVGYSGGAAIVNSLAEALSGFLHSGPLINVGIPIRNDAGQEIVPIQRSSDITERLARVSFGALSQGPMLGVEWPRLADDGTSVGTGIHFPVPTNAGGTFVTSAVVAGDLQMGTNTAAAVTPIAVVNAPDAVDPTEWTLIGNKPDISASGDVIAFVADRGPGPSTYVSVRVGGAFTTPVAVSGPDRLGTPELDLVSGRQHLTIDVAENEHDLNVGVVHHEAGDAGLADDVVVVGVFGAPKLEPARGGLYTIELELSADGTVTAGDARPVMEIIDSIDGSQVEQLGWHRVLNSVDTSPRPSEHQLAFWARTAAAEHIVQANWIATEEESSAASAMAPTAMAPTTTAPTMTATSDSVRTGPSEPRGLTSVPQAVAFETDWTLPVLIVSDVTPEAGETIVASNRSTRAGQPAVASIDYPGRTGFLTSSTNQEVLITPPAGPFVVTLETGDGKIVGLSFDVAASPSAPPVADAGGPYAISTGDDLVLDASASSDSDGTIVAYGWDLDSDGEHDDAQGVTPRVPWASIADLFCGGSCDADATFPISVEVTDDESAIATAATTVQLDVIFQDFSLALVPTSQQANPGSNHIYRVEVGTVGGFTGNVALSVDPLPTGYRATLSDSNVAAPDSVDLNVFVPSDAVEGDVPIVVRGISGGVEHDTSGSADVTFGLIPICYEPVSGIVVDTTTGAPLPGREVRLRVGFSSLFTTTGADGRFEFADIEVQTSPMQVTATEDTDYFEVNQSRTHRCGDPIDTVIEMVAREYVAAQGRVVVGVPDPADTSLSRAVVATSTPVEAATVSVFVSGGSPAPFGPTGADGTYFIDGIPLAAPDNGDLIGQLSATAPGYWPPNPRLVPFTSGPPVTVDMPLVPACTVRAGATGRVTDFDGDPLEGRVVRLWGSSGPPTPATIFVGSATTDADGRYDIPLGDSFLGRNNSSFSFSVVDAQFASSPRGSFTIDRCADEVIGEVDYEIDVTPPPPPPVRNTTTVTGRIIDGVTGQPLRLTARLTSVSGSVLGSDFPSADGTFEVGMLVGFDGVTLATGIRLSALESISQGYRGATVGPFTVSSDEPYDVGDVLVYPIDWSGLRGRVIDVATGVPLANATVAINQGAEFGGGEVSSILTDDQGFYEWNHLTKAGGDQPFTAQMVAARFNADVGDRYWNENTPVDLLPGETTVRNFELLRVCEDVTIRGNVVDAVTGLPIEGARIQTSRNAVEFTDEDGFFLFEQLRAGTRNTPTSLRLTASATGYITQSRDISIFCGATITVNFGAETGTGSVFGTVTDDTGAPIVGVFVGSGGGGSDTTSADGTYRIDDVPLGLDGAPTEWDITAIHPDGRQLVQPATVTDGGETRVDYVFPIVPNTPPVARDLFVDGVAGSSVPILLEGFDADGDPLTYDVTSDPAVGVLSGVAPDLTYAVPAGIEGVVTFTYTASDGEDTSPEATVSITVSPPNTPPTADDISTSVIAGESVDITLTGDDADGDPLVFIVLSQPAIGSVSGAPPDVTYDAPADAGGQQTTFTYWTYDGDDTSAVSTVTITIDEPPANNPPTANDISTSVIAGGSVGITLTGDDADGDPLTFTVATPPAIGSLTGTPPNLTYDAPADAGGEQATFTYTASDGEDTSTPATVTITIDEPPLNNPPTAFHINTSVEAGNSIDIELLGDDPDDDPLTFSIVQPPASGDLTGTPPDMTYSAPTDGTTEVTFTYAANDGQADSNVATVYITILPSTSETGTVFGTVQDDLGDPIEGATVLSEASFGFAFTGPDGSYLFEGVPVGTSRFIASTSDRREMVRSATVTADEPTELNFVFPTDGTPTNSPPTADDISTSVPAGGSVAITLTGSDPDDDLLGFGVIENPAIGFLSGIEPNLTYHAPEEASGVVTFGYIAEDGLEFSAPATVTITIEDPSPNNPPTADDIATSVVAGGSVDITLTGDDPDGDPLTFTIDTPPAIGSLTGTPPDTTYTAPADAGGQQATFTYTTSDGQATSEPATVTITIEPRPDRPPVLGNVDDVTMDEGDTISIDVSASDPDGDAIDLQLTSGPSWAGFSDLGGGVGTLDLSPVDDAVETITIEACAGGVCDEVTFTVTVLNVAPTLQIDAPASTQQHVPVSIEGTVTDPGTDQWTYQIDCGDGYGPTQSSPEFECSFDALGDNPISMRVVDDDDGEGTAATTIDVVATPDLSVTASNDGPAPWGIDVLLEATVEASGLTEPISYQWDLDGDGTYDTVATTDPTAITQYPNPGTRTATVEACSGLLCASGTTDVEIDRRPSSLSSPAESAVQYSDATTVSSTLIDALDGTPLTARTVDLSVAGDPGALVTDAAGTVSVGWTADVAAGPVPLNASFTGDELFEPSAASGTLDVVREDAALEWASRPNAPAPTYDVHVIVREAEDGSLGNLALTAVSFWLDEGCDGDPVAAGTYPVVDDETDGVGDVIATIDGLSGPGCVRAELNSIDGSVSQHYAAVPAEAAVGERADGFVTGGGRYDTADGWVSIGFVARREGGALSGHVEIVNHGAGIVQHRSVELTSLTIVDDRGGGSTATITAKFLQWTGDGWVETEVTLVAHDGGNGRSKDRLACDTCPPPIEGTFRGQVVVHRKRSNPQPRMR